MSWIALTFLIVLTFAFIKGYKEGQEREYKTSLYHDKLNSMRVDNPDQPYETSVEFDNE